MHCCLTWLSLSGAHLSKRIWTGHGTSLSVTLPSFLNRTWTDRFSLASLSFCCRASVEIVASAWVKSSVCSVPARGYVSAPDDEPSLAVRASWGASRIARASTIQRL